MGVAELDAAIGAYAGLGFDVRTGGGRPSCGTRSALVPVGAHHVELLTVSDRAGAHACGGAGRELGRLLDTGPEGPVAFVLASHDVRAHIGRLRRAGASMREPAPMPPTSRNGREQSWRVALPASPPWRTALPFLVQRGLDEDEPAPTGAPGTHPNGAERVVGLGVAVGDLDRAVGWYRGLLGRLEDGVRAAGEHGAEVARFHVGRCYLDLLAPTGPGSLRRLLSDRGEGLFLLEVGVPDVHRVTRLLAEADVEWTPRIGRDAPIGISARDRLGTTWVFSRPQEPIQVPGRPRT